jgi:HK97 family phage major capsid protein
VRTLNVAELRRARAATAAELTRMKTEYITLVHREAAGEATDPDRTKLDELADGIERHEGMMREHDDRIQRCERALGFEAENAEPVDGSDADGDGAGRAYKPSAARVAAQVRAGNHETDPSLIIGGMARMIAAGKGGVLESRAFSIDVLGERHPVTLALHGAAGAKRALSASIGPSGGFLVPPDYVAELIEVLRPMTVVRASFPRVIPMPRGTMQMPRQNQAATASYGGESTAIPVSQQTVGQVVATYKKLTALTPITNDLMRYSDPGVDAIVRDDLAQVIARREDLAFIRGDGTSDSPIGFRSFALASQLITSNPSYTLATAASELGGALNKIESANVPMENLGWAMHPRSKNYLLNVQNSNGFYVYREEMTLTKTLLGVPFKTTTQIPINLTVGGNSDTSEIYLVAYNQAMLFDAMTLELAVSREGTYTDSNNNLVSVFQSDQTLIRAIAEHDFHMRHDEAISVITGVRYAPAIS